MCFPLKNGLKPALLYVNLLESQGKYKSFFQLILDKTNYLIYFSLTPILIKISIVFYGISTHNLNK